MISESNNFVLQPTALMHETTGSDSTSTVGHAPLASVTYTDAGIASNITVVTDIDDPAGTGGWTDLVSISGGPFTFNTNSTTSGAARIRVDTVDAGSGKNLRMQIVIDGKVVWDQKIESSSGDTEVIWVPQWSDESGWYGRAIYCASSLVIRAARMGTFADSGSEVSTDIILYEYVKKV